jgi:hypothetical protein
VRAGARFAGAFFSLGCAATSPEDGDGSGAVVDGEDSAAFDEGEDVLEVVVRGVDVFGVVVRGVDVFGVVVLGVVDFGVVDRAVVDRGVVDFAAGVFRVVVFAAPPCPAVAFVAAASRAAADLGDALFSAVVLDDPGAEASSATACGASRGDAGSGAESVSRGILVSTPASAGCSSRLRGSTSGWAWASGSSGSESTRQPYQAAHGSQRFHHESTTTHTRLWPVDEGRG